MNRYTAGVVMLGVIVTVPVVAAPMEAPFSFDAAPGRLPKNVVPIEYTVSLTPNARAMTLAGTESVLVRFRSATATVQFNSLNEKLTDVKLDGKPVEQVVSNDEQQLTTLTLASAFPAGVHKLTFAYTGKIETQPHGLFAQQYKGNGGADGLLLSTQFEATDARRMFPCWDEPAFRATYKLTVVIPAAWTAVSNMPIEKRVEHGASASVAFLRSPKMPSYLVEFSAGDLSRISGKSDGIDLSIWAIRGREKEGEVALANAKQILADYNDYFGYRFPLPKLDSIAVPGGFNGAMENWGAIAYNDRTLLLTPSSTIADRQLVYSIQAHEMAHQWNGDLVTMGWWDDIWLNESFASWRAAKQTDFRNPTWKWWESEDYDRERAMRADARVSSHAIQQHVTDELQADNAFDSEITYNKGEAVLRMLEAYLGPDVFRSGVRSYMQARAFSNATSADLFNALNAASGKKTDQIASGWIQQPGFPLVNVTAQCDATGKRTITLSQARFLLRGTDSQGLHWQIPLQIRLGHADTLQTVLLTRDGQTESAGRCDEPLSVDADAIGFYRVKYDAATLTTNTTHFEAAPDGDRIALLDDQWALVESGREPLGPYLQLVASMGSNRDSRAWAQIVAALGRIEYDERGTPGHDEFVAFARSIIKPVSDSLGWDAQPNDPPNLQELRRSLLTDLGEWGDQSTLDQAQRRFAAFLKDHGTLGPDDQTMILAIVARNADERVFEQLHSLAKAASADADLERYYTALTLVREPKLAARAAQIALSSEIPPQLVQSRIQMVFDLVEDHHQLAWTTFTEHVNELTAPFPSFAPMLISQSVPSVYWDSVPLDQLESWVRAHVPAEMSANVDRGMESARFKLSEKKALIPEVDAYLRSRREVASGRL